ncbi:MAG: hypothetical protein NTZ72_17905 [Afipia sp.]|nr:hypothetical protein [Afipia sp.]
MIGLLFVRLCQRKIDIKTWRIIHGCIRHGKKFTGLSRRRAGLAADSVDPLYGSYVAQHAAAAFGDDLDL